MLVQPREVGAAGASSGGSCAGAAGARDRRRCSSGTRAAGRIAGRGRRGTTSSLADHAHVPREVGVHRVAETLPARSSRCRSGSSPPGPWRAPRSRCVPRPGRARGGRASAPGPSCITPCTVLPFFWSCHPRKSVPSYARVSRMFRSAMRAAARRASGGVRRRPRPRPAAAAGSPRPSARRLPWRCPGWRRACSWRICPRRRSSPSSAARTAGWPRASAGSAVEPYL